MNIFRVIVLLILVDVIIAIGYVADEESYKEATRMTIAVVVFTAFVILSWT